MRHRVRCPFVNRNVTTATPSTIVTIMTNIQYDYELGVDGPLAALHERNATPDYPVMISPPIGWIPLVLRLNESLASMLPDYTIGQVKEKFAGLRYYIAEWGVGDDDPRIELARELISEAEAESYTICQVCGGPGELREDSYYCVTACDEHRDQRWKKLTTES